MAVLRVDGGNALMVAADIGAHQLLDLVFNKLLGGDKGCLQSDLIRFRLKAGDVFVLIRHQFLRVPRAQTGGKLGDDLVADGTDILYQRFLHCGRRGGSTASDRRAIVTARAARHQHVIVKKRHIARDVGPVGAGARFSDCLTFAIG